jgi:PAS domain-containing protein
VQVSEQIIQQTVALVCSPSAEEYEPEPEFDSEVEYSPAELEFQLILKSLRILRRRGTGDSAWTTSLEEEPLTFLLDAVSDAWIVRNQKGGVLFANQAARELELESRTFSRFETFIFQELEYEKRGLSYAGITLEVATRSK